MIAVFKVFLLFFIYSVIGWLLEVVLMLFKNQKFNNCGFLTGPYCPIYGIAAIIMHALLIKHINSPITVFVYAFIICSITEYAISLILEKIIKIKWWDYSEIPFNINGRICLPFSIIFGILGLIIMYEVNPRLMALIDYIYPPLLIVISSVLILIMAADLVFSLIIARKINIRHNVKVNDYTEQITTISKNRIKKIIGLFKKNDQ